MLREGHVHPERALAVLLLSFSPSALSEEDLQFLIADLFVHPPLLMHGSMILTRSDFFDYADTLMQAIALLRPPGAAESLLRIVKARDIPRALYRGPCSDRWALSALAAAYPEQALDHVDRYLAQSSAHSRWAGVAAAMRLPEPLARPRLFRAARDAAPLVATRARRAWEQIYEVPFDPGLGLDGAPVAGIHVELGPLAELLDGPPSDLLPSRLAILRGESDEARQAMIEVLLHEAPSRAATSGGPG